MPFSSPSPLSKEAGEAMESAETPASTNQLSHHFTGWKTSSDISSGKEAWHPGIFTSNPCRTTLRMWKWRHFLPDSQGQRSQQQASPTEVSEVSSRSNQVARPSQHLQHLSLQQFPLSSSLFNHREDYETGSFQSHHSHKRFTPSARTILGVRF